MMPPQQQQQQQSNELRRRRRGRGWIPRPARDRTSDSHHEDDEGMDSVRRKDPAAADQKSSNGLADVAKEASLSASRVTNEETVENTSPGVGRSAATRRLLAHDEEALSFRVAKWAILRLLGAVYLFAFLGAHFQNEGLMGTHGLVPVHTTLLRLPQESSTRGFFHHPTVFWFVPLTDENLSRLYMFGVVLSCLAASGINSWILQFALWLSYFSIVTVAQLLAQSSGGSFYSYGWESQLLETGFLAIFLCELPRLARSRARMQWGLDLALYETPSADTVTTTAAARSNPPPSPIVRWLFCWLMFRISLGAGLIKVRGSSCWKDKTCLHYHFETQPIPSPTSFVFHFLPPAVQRRMVDVDLWVQLYTSALVLIPVEMLSSKRSSWRRVATFLLRLGGVLQVGFMVGILLSGNFAFLNHLTIIPGLACFDDGFVPKFLLNHVVKNEKHAASQDFGSDPDPPSHRRWFCRSRTWIDLALLSLVTFLSWPVVANLLQLRGSQQIMNASFDPFRIVNTYGAFGSVGKARYEAIVQIHNGTDWIEVELPCKPGNVRRRPCFCAPSHYRLDWNIWFLGFKPHQGMLRQRESWMFSLLVKLLSRGPQPRPWLDLLDSQSSKFLKENFFDYGKAPLQAKVDMYHYKMNKSLRDLLRDLWKGKEVVWWRRRFEENLIPPVVLDASGTRLELAPAD